MTVTSYKSNKFLYGFLVSPKTSALLRYFTVLCEQKVYCECVCVCLCTLCQLNFVRECVCVYSLSVKLLVSRLRQGVCVCVLSVS